MEKSERRDLVARREKKWRGALGAREAREARRRGLGKAGVGRGEEISLSMDKGKSLWDWRGLVLVRGEELLGFRALFIYLFFLFNSRLAGDHGVLEA